MCLFAALALVSCRDELAGPKPKPLAAQGAQNQAPQQNAPPPQQRPMQPQAPAPLDAVPPDLTWKSEATWLGGTVRYYGSKLEPAHPVVGQPLRITHYFSALKPPPQQWQFFVHIADANSGQMVGNADHEFQNGAAPLGSWPVGKVMADVQQVQMPNYPGTLQLMLGFWQGEARLQVDDPKFHDGQGRVFGPKLEGPQQTPLPEYHVPRTAKPPVIDGKLDDEVWKAAPEVNLVTSFDGRPVQRATRARLLYDDANIYVAFDCDDPDVWGDLKNKDDAIYNEVVVEIFLDANADQKSYNELEVSPHNVQFDAAFVTRRSDLPEAMKWDSGMVSAVQVRGTIDNDSDTDQGWSVEMQIPIARLMEVPHLPPQKGDRWRFNLYRLEHFKRRQQIEGQAFSPLYQGDFHNLPRFGWLVFE